MDLKERDALGDKADEHWYYVSKAKMISRLIPDTSKEVLDVGAGIGWFSRWLVKNGHVEKSVCVDPGYGQEMEEQIYEGKGISFVRSIESTDADVVLLMDVIEHVDDDVALLKEYWEKTKPGTVFIITVPAFQFLWSAHDEFLDHRRRYTSTSLATTIAAIGATPERLNYFYGSIFPVALVMRLLKRKGDPTKSDMRPAPHAINLVLTWVLGIEARIAKWNKLAGLTVVAQFRKPDPNSSRKPIKREHAQ